MIDFSLSKYFFTLYYLVLVLAAYRSMDKTIRHDTGKPHTLYSISYPSK